MKKCPECGNPSYDGAPVCGNCGYTFPKPKVKVSKEDTIFEDRPIINKSENEQSTLDIIKENKLAIGAILLITLLVIGVIIVTGPNNTTQTKTDSLNKYSDAGFSFSYPSSWNETTGYDELHEGAVFFEDSNGTVIEYYNVSSEFSSIYQVNNERVSAALADGDNINTILPTQIDSKNASDIIIESTGGNFTRYVSIISDGNLFVYKIKANSMDGIKTTEIDSVLQSTRIG